MSTPPPFAAFPSQWMKHGALLQGLPLTRALEEFFLRFTTAFWLTSINRYHGFSRVGLARFFPRFSILGDPGGDSGDEGKSKQAEKYGTKKSKERREEPLGTMSYQTSSKRSRFSRRSLLFFVPCFSACLDFPSPLLSAPGSPRMNTITTIQRISISLFYLNE